MKDGSREPEPVLLQVVEVGQGHHSGGDRGADIAAHHHGYPLPQGDDVPGSHGHHDGGGGGGGLDDSGGEHAQHQAQDGVIQACVGQHTCGQIGAKQLERNFEYG